MAKPPVTKKSAQKKPAAGAKKGGKKSSAMEATSAKKGTSKGPVSAQISARATAGTEPPVWMPGVLTEGEDEENPGVLVVGLQTAEGFISLKKAADRGEMVGLFFPLTNPGSPELFTMMNKLMAFIAEHANGVIAGGVTCCEP